MTQRWLLIGILAVLAYVLGVWGYYLALEPSGGTLLDAAYQTFHLFRMRYTGQGPIPWQLEVARFLAPLATMIAVGKIALSFLRDQWGAFRVRRAWNGHDVVIGSDDATRALVKDISRRGVKVVLVSDSPASVSDDSLWGPHCVILRDSLCDDATWEAARLDRAGTLTIMTADDEFNLDAMRRAKIWCQQKRPGDQEQLQANCRFADNRIRHLLRDGTDFFNPLPQIATSAFNPYQRAARMVLRDYLLEGERPPRGIQPRALLTGTGVMTENLVFWIAMTGHFANDIKTWITLCDPTASTFWERLIRSYPGIDHLVRCEPVDEDPEILTADHLASIGGDMKFTSAYFCGLSGGRNLVAANRCAPVLQQCQKVVIFERHGGLAAILKTQDGAGIERSADASPVVFELTANTCTREGILQQDLDRYASHAANEYYLKATGEWNMSRGQTPAVYPWAELSEEWRDANRTQADHIGTKLRTINAEEVTRAEADPDFAFANSEIELLARMEHARWMAQRIMYGWTLGDPRDDAARRHPDITTWENLDEHARQKDRDAVGLIPEGLRQVGRGVRRVAVA